MTSPRKRFPPFGKQLYEQRLAGRVPDHVKVVFDWDLARCFPRVVIPDDAPLDQVELCFLAGLDVTIGYHDKDSSRVPDLVQKILSVRPRILNCFNASIPKTFILKNSKGEVFA